MSQPHEVYVIYRDGKPFSGNRAAYYTKRDANSAVTRFVKDSFRWGEYTEEKAVHKRQHYAVITYVAKEVSE
ncbi:hypothetical protein NQ117_05390 [Paenibacillus sp. SC116]|uniref:hypothetical protein n=1 Tax=Paenibacillus sp. SC116 TaxID=2968986 RepID=UPI00215A5D8C|nr:hypothetical protein [Paenibacillus sp. SC116]MCR8843106.1 hypothetical protein [Paenibacillus sp. SC116]